MLERSIQAKFLIPIVVSLVSGVFVAFFVTLLMVPALYAIGFDVKDSWARFSKRVRTRPTGRKSRDESLAAGRTP